MKNHQSKINAFSLVELLVAIAIGTIVVSAAYLAFPLGLKIAREGEAINQLSQSARVILGRIERDIRQTPNIITSLPLSQDNATDQIFLEDGFPEESDANPHYINYYFENNKIYRQETHYTNPNIPEEIVTYNFQSAIEVIETDEIIGENVEFIDIWKVSSLVKIDIKLKKLQDDIRFLSTVYPRNN